MYDLEKIKFFRKLVIISIFSNDYLMDTFVLKGGSAIDIIYKLSSRSSMDIDLSMPNSFKPEELDKIQEIIQEAIYSTFYDEGYTVFDLKFSERPKSLSSDLESFWGGYLLEFKIYPTITSSIITKDLDAARRSAEVTGFNNEKN